jgi:hypothetical protein
MELAVLTVGACWLALGIALSVMLAVLPVNRAEGRRAILLWSPLTLAAPILMIAATLAGNG